MLLAGVAAAAKTKGNKTPRQPVHRVGGLRGWDASDDESDGADDLDDFIVPDDVEF